MSSKYRLYGPLGFSYRARDFLRWVLLFPDGNELTLSRKRYAVMAAKAVLARDDDIRIFEETVMRSIMPNDEVREDSFRIDITERVKLEMEAESINKKTTRL